MYIQIVSYLLNSSSPIDVSKEENIQIANFVAEYYGKAEIDGDYHIKILSNIFSALSLESEGRVIIFSALIDACIKNNKSYLLTPYLMKLQIILPWTTMTLDQRVEIFQSVINMLKKTEGNPLLHPQLLELLKIFSEATDAEIIKYTDLLATSLIEIIKNDENLFELGELSQLPHIQIFLKQKPEILALIQGILTGDVNNADKLFETNKTLLTGAGINKEDLKNKVRFTLMSTIADSNTSMSFKDLSEKLQCGEDEIEILLITVIEHGFLEALIDQSQQLIHFRTVFKRNTCQATPENLPQKIDNLIAIFSKFAERNEDN